MIGGGGGNGHWVRTHNRQSAKLFIAERQLEAERREAQRQRDREFLTRVVARVRSWFRR